MLNDSPKLEAPCCFFFYSRYKKIKLYLIVSEINYSKSINAMYIRLPNCNIISVSRSSSLLPQLGDRRLYRQPQTLSPLFHIIVTKNHGHFNSSASNFFIDSTFKTKFNYLVKMAKKDCMP